MSLVTWSILPSLSTTINPITMGLLFASVALKLNYTADSVERKVSATEQLR